MEAISNCEGKMSNSKPESSIYVIKVEKDEEPNHMDQKTFWTLFSALMLILVVEVYLINTRINCLKKKTDEDWLSA